MTFLDVLTLVLIFLILSAETSAFSEPTCETNEYKLERHTFCQSTEEHTELLVHESGEAPKEPTHILKIYAGSLFVDILIVDRGDFLIDPFVFDAPAPAKKHLEVIVFRDGLQVYSDADASSTDTPEEIDYFKKDPNQNQYTFFYVENNFDFYINTSGCHETEEIELTYKVEGCIFWFCDACANYKCPVGEPVCNGENVYCSEPKTTYSFDNRLILAIPLICLLISSVAIFMSFKPRTTSHVEHDIHSSIELEKVKETKIQVEFNTRVKENRRYKNNNRVMIETDDASESPFEYKDDHHNDIYGTETSSEEERKVDIIIKHINNKHNKYHSSIPKIKLQKQRMKKQRLRFDNDISAIDSSEQHLDESSSSSSSIDEYGIRPTKPYEYGIRPTKPSPSHSMIVKNSSDNKLWGQNVLGIRRSPSRLLKNTSDNSFVWENESSLIESNEEETILPIKVFLSNKESIYTDSSLQQQRNIENQSTKNECKKQQKKLQQQCQTVQKLKIKLKKKLKEIEVRLEENNKSGNKYLVESDDEETISPIQTFFRKKLIYNNESQQNIENISTNVSENITNEIQIISTNRGPNGSIKDIGVDNFGSSYEICYSDFGATTIRNVSNTQIILEPFISDTYLSAVEDLKLKHFITDAYFNDKLDSPCEQENLKSEYYCTETSIKNENVNILDTSPKDIVFNEECDDHQFTETDVEDEENGIDVINVINEILRSNECLDV